MTVSGSERGSGITSRLGPGRIGSGHKRPHDCERLQGMHPGGGSTSTSGLGNYSFMAWEGVLFCLWALFYYCPFFFGRGLGPGRFFFGLGGGGEGVLVVGVWGNLNFLVWVAPF